MGISLNSRMLLGGAVAVLLFTLDLGRVTGAVTADWSLDRSDELVNAFINLTYYVQEAKKVHTEKSEEVIQDDVPAYLALKLGRPPHRNIAFYKVGRFGVGKVGSAYGLVIHVRSGNSSEYHDGCELPWANTIPNDTAWIALIRRGNCSFETKLENAYKMRAAAMVVYDTDTREELERMDFKARHSYAIPGVLTYKWKGEEIANLVDNGTAVTMYITVGETRLPFNGINRTSVLFVSISFIVLMIISLAWLVFYYVQRFRYLHAKDRLAQRLCNAAKKALAKIPTRNIKLTDKELNSSEGECCAVCIEAYRSGDTLRTLPCKHEFHKTCVDPWLLEHRTCPMCKMDILKYYGYIFTGSQESILHLDLDDNVMNSSESRETDSPPQEPRHHAHLTAQMEDHPQSSVSSSFPSQQTLGSMRKPSLISLTVVAAPRGSITTSTPVAESLDPEASTKGSVNSSHARIPTSSDEKATHEIQHPMCTVSPESKQPEQCDVVTTEDESGNKRASRAGSQVSSCGDILAAAVEQQQQQQSSDLPLSNSISNSCPNAEDKPPCQHDDLGGESNNEISSEESKEIGTVSVQIEENENDKCVKQ